MAITGLDNLACWVQQNAQPLIYNVPWGAPTIQFLTPRLGIKCSEAIGRLDVNVQFQECGCDTNIAGEINFSDRLIEVSCIKIRDHICDYDFLCTRYEQYIRITAGQETIGSLEEWIVRAVLLDVSNKLEIALWQGDITSSNPNLNKFDGYLKILDAANPATPPAQPGVPAANKFTQNAGETDYAFIRRMTLSAPSLQARTRGPVVMFIGLDRFESIVANNIDLRFTFLENPNIPGGLREEYQGAQSFVLPGTNIRVIGVPGLIGTDRIVSGALSNMFWGSDYANDKETIVFDYSDYHQHYYYIIKFFMGVQVGFEDEIIVGTFTQDITTGATPTFGVNILSPLGDNGGVLTTTTAAALGRAAGASAVEALLAAGAVTTPEPEVTPKKVKASKKAKEEATPEPEVTESNTENPE